MPLFCAPTALQRLFHHDGERAVAKAAEKFGTMFGISSLGTISIEEIGSTISTPKLFQLYFHKDRGLTNSMIERCLNQIRRGVEIPDFSLFGKRSNAFIGLDRRRADPAGLPRPSA